MKVKASPAWLGRCAMIATVVGIALITVVWTVGLVQRAHDQHAFAVDFAINIWQPARAILAGDDPFGDLGVGSDDRGVYPPIASTLALPFALLPFGLARVMWTVTLLAALLASLRICGVRDWRCYLAACACPPVTAGVMYGNVSLLMMLAVALAWRFRDKAWAVGSLIGLAVAVKLFLWPLAVWLAITRRSFGFAASITAAGVLTLIGWTAVGFVGFTDYPSIIRDNTAKYDQDGVSVAALAANIGLPANQVLALAAGLVALLIAWRLRRNDLGSFGWALTAALLASPLVWWHYYALLLVPLALAAPVWRPIWFAPFGLFPQAADAVVGIAISVLIAVTASGVRLRSLRTEISGRDAPQSPPLPPSDAAAGTVAD